MKRGLPAERKACHGSPVDGFEVKRGSCRTIGDVLNRHHRRRVKSLTRKSSVSREALRGFFRPFDSKTHGAILKAAERFENLTKRKGCRNGALGYVGIKVLKALLEFIDYRTGRLEPSYVALCKRAYLSVCAVAAALKRLAAHGFIEMIRRYEPTGNISGGPTVRQITNAYRVSLPAVAAKTLRTSPTAPVPDDERARRKEQRDERERMIAQLPEWEQPVARTNIADPSLAEILNRLGRAIYAASHPAVSL